MTSRKERFRPHAGDLEHTILDSPSDSLRGIEITDFGWKIETCKKPIVNAKEIEAAGEELSIPLPEITFGNNHLSMSHQRTGLRYTFNALDALKSVDPTGEEEGGGMVKVSYADAWAKSRASSASTEEHISKVVNPFDWTYTTTYAGSSSSTNPDHDEDSGPRFRTAPGSHPGIPLEQLKRAEKILFYDDVILFEDELHDNGMALLGVKIRVMPSSFFILSRFFLRVDNVLFRIFDVRIFHAFGSKEIIRETLGRQASYEEIKKKLPPEKPDDLTPLTDSNWVAATMDQTPEGVSLSPTSSQSPTSTTRAAAPTPAPFATTTRTPAPISSSVSSAYPQVTVPNRTPPVLLQSSSTTAMATPNSGSARPSYSDRQPVGGPDKAGDGDGDGSKPSKKPWKGLGRTLEVARLD